MYGPHEKVPLQTIQKLVKSGALKVISGNKSALFKDNARVYKHTHNKPPFRTVQELIRSGALKRISNNRPILKDTREPRRICPNRPSRSYIPTPTSTETPTP